MACFLAPATEAIAVSIAQDVTYHKEKLALAKREVKSLEPETASWSRKLGWLNSMLWGGSFLLAIEHIWHGEVVPFFPFLTAMKNPDDASAMLHEIFTTGVSMALSVTAVWGVMLLIYWLKAERSNQKPALAKAGKSL